MAYDQVLAERIRGVVQGERDLTEQRMFGGLAFLVHGSMAVAASGEGGLMLRCDPAETEALLDPPRVRRVEMRGREMDGWLRVSDEAVAADEDLRRWVTVGLEYARSLPPT
ncbi:TfoX/Sxy family protein [uncultured Phycicoccus sp.]|uniref:TfoX/Sxy family protein n=1 Tax=uncultured Phycicoccus sp. TaxID=661422 RepID=UPI0026230853|nr:TfoX/Sxy family protein [uncultured Phycicoccus sp.]